MIVVRPLIRSRRCNTFSLVVFLISTFVTRRPVLVLMISNGSRLFLTASKWFAVTSCQQSTLLPTFVPGTCLAPYLLDSRHDTCMLVCILGEMELTEKWSCLIAPGRCLLKDIRYRFPLAQSQRVTDT
jgi:hypothetical protein